MNVRVVATLIAGLGLSAAAMASECTLTVAGKAIEFPHVLARAEPNHFDESKEDVIVHCFREEIPRDKRSPSEIIWFRPESGRIDIKLSPNGYVTMVDVASDEVTGMISGANFGVELDGRRDGNRLVGSMKTTEDLTTHFDGEESEPWRVSATLDLDVIGE